MAIAASTPYISYTGNGALKEYSYTFPVLKLDFLQVRLDGVTQRAGIDFQATFGVSGGSVTFTTVPPDQTKIEIFRQQPIAQPLDIKNSETTNLRSIESGLDKLTMIDQELRRDIDNFEQGEIQSYKNISDERVNNVSGILGEIEGKTSNLKLTVGQVTENRVGWFSSKYPVGYGRPATYNPGAIGSLIPEPPPPFAHTERFFSISWGQGSRGSLTGNYIYIETGTINPSSEASILRYPYSIQVNGGEILTSKGPEGRGGDVFITSDGYETLTVRRYIIPYEYETPTVGEELDIVLFENLYRGPETSQNTIDEIFFDNNNVSSESVKLTIPQVKSLIGAGTGSGSGGGLDTDLSNLDSDLSESEKETVQEKLGFGSDEITRVTSPVTTEQLTVYHDPNRIDGTVGVPLYRIIQILEGSDAAAKAMYTARKASSFVPADVFRPPTVESLTVGTGAQQETHKALVISFPGDFKKQTYLHVEYNDHSQEISKDLDIPVQTISNGYDWKVADARAQEDNNKRELLVRCAYDPATNTSKVYIHQEAVPSAQDVSTEIFPYIVYFIKETALSVKGDKGDPPDNLAALLQPLNETRTYKAGDFFYEGVGTSVILVEVLRSFHPAGENYNSNNFEDFVFRQGHTSNPLRIVGNFANVTQITSLTSAVANNRATITLNYLDGYAKAQSKTTSFALPSGGSGSTDLSNYYTKAEADTKVNEAKDAAIGAGQELYAIWLGKHGDPSSSTNAASRPVAGLSGVSSYNATTETLDISRNSVGGAGVVYWQNNSIDFKRCVLTAEFTLGNGGTNNVGRSFAFNLGGNNNTLTAGNTLTIAVDLDGYDLGAPGGTRQFYIYNRSNSTYLGSKILNNKLLSGVLLELRVEINVDEIRCYLNGELELLIENATLPAMDGSFFGCTGNSTLTKVSAIAIEQMNLDAAAPHLGLPMVQDAEVSGSNLTLKRRGADDKVLALPSGGVNSAIEALAGSSASDMQWVVEVQTYNNASAPANPATIGLAYRIFLSGHRIDFVFPNATTKAQIDALVLGKRFAIETPQGPIVFKPTSHVATAVVAGGFHRERYGGTIEPSFTGFTNSSDVNNDLQTTLYRGLDRPYISHRFGTYSRETTLFTIQQGDTRAYTLPPGTTLNDFYGVVIWASYSGGGTEYPLNPTPIILKDDIPASSVGLNDYLKLKILAATFGGNNTYYDALKIAHTPADNQLSFYSEYFRVFIVRIELYKV